MTLLKTRHEELKCHRRLVSSNEENKLRKFDGKLKHGFIKIVQTNFFYLIFFKNKLHNIFVLE